MLLIKLNLQIVICLFHVKHSNVCLAVEDFCLIWSSHAGSEQPLCFCCVQEESKMWLKKVWRQRNEGPLRAAHMTLHHERGVSTLLITFSLRQQLHNFATAGVVMNVLRLYASNIARKKNADNHQKKKKELSARGLKKTKRKIKGLLPSYFHLNTQLCLQPSLSGVLLQHTYTHLAKHQIIKGKRTRCVHAHTETLKGYYCTLTHMVHNSLLILAKVQQPHTGWWVFYDCKFQEKSVFGR